MPNINEPHGPWTCPECGETTDKAFLEQAESVIGRILSSTPGVPDHVSLRIRIMDSVRSIVRSLNDA